MQERLSLSGLWTDTLASYRRNASVFLTLAAAFLFLPQMIVGLLLQASGVEFTIEQILKGARPPAWLFPVNLVVLLVQLLCIIPVTKVVLGQVHSNETVGELIADAFRRVPGFLLAILWLFLLYIGVVIALALPVGLLAGFAGAGVARGAAGGAAATLGMLLLGVALGLILYLVARMSVWFAVFVVENPGPRAVVRRSWDLTRGHAGRILLIFMVVLLGVIIAAAAIGALGAALGVVGQAVGSAGAGSFLFMAVNGLFSAIATLLLYIFTAHLYRRLLALGSVPYA